MNPACTIETLPEDVRGALTRLAVLIQSAPAELRDVLLHACDDSTKDPSAARLEVAANWLYGNWYTQQPDPRHIDQSEQMPPDLRSALAVAACASGHWQHGWVALQSDPSGVCLAGHGRVNRWLYPGQYANVARPGMPVAPGDALVVNELVDHVDEATGFWVSQSVIGAPEPPLVRLYFNVGWQRVGQVLHDVTRWLAGAATKYSLKYPIVPNITQRVDTLVVYLERSQWDALESSAIVLAEQLQDCLRPATPPLTRRLAPGMSCADDPGASTSFGQSRCNALAPTVLELVGGPTTQQHALSRMVEVLVASSVDPKMPWRVGPS